MKYIVYLNIYIYIYIYIISLASNYIKDILGEEGNNVEANFYSRIYVMRNNDEEDCPISSNKN
jgi:hypothetical protein